MIRRPPRSTLDRSSAASDVYKRQNSIIVVEDFTFNAPKTKQFVDIIKGLKLDGKKSIFVTPEYNSMVYLSGRNIPKTSIQVAKDLSTYEILNTATLVLTCLLYTSPSPRDRTRSRMPSSA